MEKENNYFNCHLNWSTTEAAGAPLLYALPDQLQQCFIPLNSNGQLEVLVNSVGMPMKPQQWSGTSNMECFGTQSFKSLPKLDLAMVNHQKQGVHAGFAEQATRMSCFSPGIPNHGGQLPLSETRRLPRGRAQIGAVESKNEMSMPSRSSTGEDGELRCIRAESSASEHTSDESNARKRKSIKVGEDGGEVKVKRSRTKESDGGGKDEVKPNVEVEGANEDPIPGEEEAKGPEAPKQDYIHVRARRGQATDAHSLAERVRRERISERMKFLQNLVPGCNKVTGKAVMLDEIINYVQSLQRQVEFLSMKLATVNPRLDINVETILQKDMHQHRGSSSHSIYQIETSAPAFPFAHQPPQGAYLQTIATNGIGGHCSANPLDSMLTRRPLGAQFPVLDGFVDAGSQVGVFWEDDLHRVVQMGSGQNQEDMKIEL